MSMKIFDYVWDAPEGLVTQPALRQRGLRLPEPVPEPVAYARSKWGMCALYDIESAVPVSKRPQKDWGEIMERKYPDPAEAISPAAAAMFTLNRYASHESCSIANRREIYNLKGRFIAGLYCHGYCTEALFIPEHMREVGSCCRCMGTGKGGFGVEWVDPENDYTCPKCKGTGKYRKMMPAYWAFRFEIDGKKYAWHSPASSCLWAKPIGDQDLENHAFPEPEREINEAYKRKFPELKATVRRAIVALEGNSNLDIAS